MLQAMICFHDRGIGCAAWYGLILMASTLAPAGALFAADDNAAVHGRDSAIDQQALFGWARTSDQAQPSADEMVQRCVDRPHSFKKVKCLGGYFRELVRERSARYAIEQARVFMDSGRVEDCHLVAHMVGKATIVKHDYNLKRSLKACSMDCIQGCVHGAVQGYITHHSAREDFKSSVSRICEPFSSDAMLRRQCIHGVGHGLLTDGLMPLGEAVELCRGFDERETRTCWGGSSTARVPPSTAGPTSSRRIVTRSSVRRSIPTLASIRRSSSRLASRRSTG